MFDRPLQSFLARALDAPAALLVQMGCSANAITVLGGIFGGLGFVSISIGWIDGGLGFVLANRLCDGLDGAVARRVGTTDFGGFLDIVVDFVFYASVPLAFAIYNPSYALPAAFVIFTFMGTGASFLGFAIIAAKRGLKPESLAAKLGMGSGIKGKAFYYAGGLAEGGETLVFLILICLFPDWFASIAIGFGVLCLATLAGRIRMASLVFSHTPQPAGD